MVPRTRKGNFNGWGVSIAGQSVEFIHKLLCPMSNELKTPIHNSVSSSVTSEIDVDWEKPISETTPYLFGSNDYKTFSQRAAADSLLHDRLRKLDLGVFRIHSPHLTNLLADSFSRSWDESAVREAIDTRRFAKSRVVIAIPGWPSWMQQDRDRLLAPQEYRNYARFCANLVRIVNLQLKQKVVYWEPLAGIESRYRRAGRLEELWKIFNITSTVMRLRDPSIQVGGPSLSTFDTELLRSFLQSCKFNVDFICWSDYLPTNLFETTEKLMASTPDYYSRVKTMQALIRRFIPNRRVPLLLAEYNIENPWQSRGGRHVTHVGATWIASVLKHLADAHIDMAASSHLRDEASGLIGGDYRLRPAATLFSWAQKYLIGHVFATTSTHPLIEALAVRPDNQCYALMLINKTDVTADLSLQTREILMSKTIRVHTIDASGTEYSSLSSISIYKRTLAMAPYSVKLLLFER